MDAKGALYVGVQLENNASVWVFEHSGQGTRQTRYFPIPYSSPLYNFVMAVCRTPQGGEVLWVWGQDSQIVPIRMVALQLSTDGQLLRSQLLPQTFMGQRRTPPASCDPDTGALMVGILNGRELGYVAVNGTAWFTPLALPPVETNSRPSTPGDALYSNDQLIIYGDNLAAIYVYNRRTLAMTGSLYSRVAAVLGASDITALADGSFVLGSASGFYSLGARIDAQAVVLDRLGVYEHNVSTELAYRRLVTADPRNGVAYAVEAVIPQRGLSSTWVRVFVNGQYRSSFRNEDFSSNPVFDQSKGCCGPRGRRVDWAALPSGPWTPRGAARWCTPSTPRTYPRPAGTPPSPSTTAGRARSC